MNPGCNGVGVSYECCEFRINTAEVGVSDSDSLTLDSMTNHVLVVLLT